MEIRSVSVITLALILLSHMHHIDSPEKVAEGVLELITDTSKAGAAMAITYNKGLTYPELLDNEKFES